MLFCIRLFFNVYMFKRNSLSHVYMCVCVYIHIYTDILQNKFVTDISYLIGLCLVTILV